MLIPDEILQIIDNVEKGLKEIQSCSSNLKFKLNVNNKESKIDCEWLDIVFHFFLMDYTIFVLYTKVHYGIKS